MHADAGAIGLAAKQSGTAPELLLLCLRSAWAPVMAAARPALLNGISTELWRRPYCPVCGSEPDMAVLENHPDPSEFLVSKSGEVWHHCPACLHRWRFVRVACPACGNLANAYPLCSYQVTPLYFKNTVFHLKKNYIVISKVYNFRE